MKPQRVCKTCGEPVKSDGRRFTVGDGSIGTVTGDFCRPLCWAIAQYGPEQALLAYERAFIPRNGWGDADTLQPEEGIVR